MSCSFPSPFCPPWHFLIYIFHPAAWPQGRADRLPAHGAALTAAPRRQPEARALRAAAALTCDVLAFSQLQHPSRRGQTTQISLQVNITIKSLSLEGDNPALHTVNALNSAGVQLLRNAPLPHTERSPLASCPRAPHRLPRGSAPTASALPQLRGRSQPSQRLYLSAKAPSRRTAAERPIRTEAFANGAGATKRPAAKPPRAGSSLQCAHLD